MGYSEIENLWYATTSNIQAFWNSNLKRHTAHANLWCATKWNIQKLESETPHLHLFCVIWNINYRNSENPRSESNQTQTYREDTKHPWTASLWLSHCRCTFRADDLSSSTSSSKKKFLLKKIRTDLDKCVSSLSA